MKIGDRGYIVEAASYGPEQKFIPPTLFELVEICPGCNTTHYIFQGVNGGYKQSLTDIDIELGFWLFRSTATPLCFHERNRFKKNRSLAAKAHFKKLHNGGFVI